MKALTLALALPVLVGLTGCQIHTKTPLQAELPTQQTTLGIGKDQSVLEGEIVASNMTMAMGGGLAFALLDGVINASRASEVSDNIETIREDLQGFDFHEELKTHLLVSLDSSPVVSVETHNWVMTSLLEKDQTAHDEFQGTSLVIDPSYRLIDEFRKVLISAEVELRTDDTELIAQLKTKTKPKGANKHLLYKNELIVLVDLPYVNRDNKVILEENKSEVVKDALVSACRLMASMIEYDIQSPTIKPVRTRGYFDYRIEDGLSDRAWNEVSFGETGKAYRNNLGELIGNVSL